MREYCYAKKTLIWFEGLPSWQFAEYLDELQEVLEILAENKTPVIDNLGFFKASFSFKGRIRRTYWWISALV